MWKYNNELYHYGVLGMRWGHRNASGVSKSSRSKNKTKGWNKDAKEAHRISKKNVHQMSNQELRTLNNRKQLESTYKNLNPSIVKRGGRAAKTTAAAMGTALAIYGGGSQLIKIGSKVASKYIK